MHLGEGDAEGAGVGVGGATTRWRAVDVPVVEAGAGAVNAGGCAVLGEAGAGGVVGGL